MNDQNRERTSNCLTDTLNTILCLQDNKNDFCDAAGCDKPFLGPSPNIICYNTRPFNLYNCCTGDIWTFPYTIGTITGTSNILRICNLDENCATCRVLAPNPDTSNQEEPFVATSTFITINLDCVSAIKCLADTFVSGV